MSFVAFVPSGATDQMSYLSFKSTVASSFVQPAAPNDGFCLMVASDSLSMNCVAAAFEMFVTAFV